MAKIFDRVKLTKPRKNSFDLSHERKMTLNPGDLVPCLVQEVIPGDKFRVRQEHLVRFQALMAPIMHRVNVYTHYFFVPNRIIWNEWEDFITGGDDGLAEPVFPRIKIQIDEQGAALFEKGSLADYLGVPVKNISTGDNKGININSLPFRAYQTIYNEYYRDQNLQEPVKVSKSSGIERNLDQLLQLRKRAWEKDYFTSALPFAQKGEEMRIPSADMEIVGNNKLPTFKGQTNRADGDLSVKYEVNGRSYLVQDQGTQTEQKILFGDETGLKAKTNEGTNTTINELRQAFSIQRWLEKAARGGSRYVEQLLVQFGVRSSDARLQRPEYLGGGKNPVIVSEVLQQSESQNTPLGTMGGHGISVGSSNQFTRYFEEHGYVIGIMSVMPRSAYMQGLPRHFKKFDRFDYFWPDLAHLGEQPVYNSELYADFDITGEDSETFGYQPRYAEYRFNNDTVHGDFLDSLSYWHMGRDFKNRPALNGNFVSTNDIPRRVFAVQEENQHQLLVQTYTDFQAIRPLPKYGTPGGL